VTDGIQAQGSGCVSSETVQPSGINEAMNGSSVTESQQLLVNLLLLFYTPISGQLG